MEKDEEKRREKTKNKLGDRENLNMQGGRIGGIGGQGGRDSVKGRTELSPFLPFSRSAAKLPADKNNLQRVRDQNEPE